MIKDDSAAVDDADKRWHQNADEIAMFLAGINPNWSMKEWQKMLYDHLAMTKDEASDLFNEKFVDSINMFDNVERQALGMADTMTNGIILQFPQYFR